MHQLFSVVHNGIPTKVSWFRLFKHMDDDASGLISYIEFAGMVREELLLDSHALPEKALKKVWLALDDDGSGQLKVGEFGQFMQLGYRDLTTKAEARRKEIHEANMRAAAAVRAEEDKLFDRDIARSMSGEAPATEEEVCSPLFSKCFRPPLPCFLCSKPHSRQPPALLLDWLLFTGGRSCVEALQEDAPALLSRPQRRTNQSLVVPPVRRRHCHHS